MRFNCGKTSEQKASEKWEAKKQWHRKFAWWPTRVGPYDCRWLENVERKGTFVCGYDDARWEYEYRALETYHC